MSVPIGFFKKSGSVGVIPAQSEDDELNIRGKVIVMSGATSGIGEVAAERLAGLGARLVLVARDRSRGETMRRKLAAMAPDMAHAVHYGDLSRLAEVRRVAHDIATTEPRIDILINNAGAIFSSRAVTEERLERTFALNHMSYFVLTALLQDRLIAAAPSRIINTASNAHRNGHLDFDDLQSTNYVIVRLACMAPQSSATSFSPASWLAGSRPNA